MKLIFIFILFIFSIFFGKNCFAQNGNEKFKIVIDPGHGGKDPGTPGTRRYKSSEKTIALDVSLMLGKLIKQYMPDAEVIYTRSKDVFITLSGRSKLANKKKADLFISIHCNAATNPYSYGTETFVMGLHKSQSNFEIAKRENEVMLLEEDYHVEYQNFNPYSIDSYIGLTLFQNEYLEQSLKLAAYIQDEFTFKVKRKNRGVKQAGFWVISKNIMPSVLIELGFLTNKKEEDFLNTGKGKKDMATAIYNAIKKYRSSLVIDELGLDTEPVNVSDNPVKTPKKPENMPNGTYAVQLLVTKKNYSNTNKLFDGLNSVKKLTLKNNLYKYIFGENKSFEQAYKNLNTAKSYGFDDAFIIFKKDGNKNFLSLFSVIKNLPKVKMDKINVSELPKPTKAPKEDILKEKPFTKIVANSNSKLEYRVQLRASKEKVPLNSSNFKGLIDVYEIKEDDVYKYMYGKTSTYNEILRKKTETKIMGFEDSFIVSYLRGEKIPIYKAKNIENSIKEKQNKK